MNRPISVTLSLCLVLIFATWNLIKTWTFIAWRDILLEFSAQPNPHLSAILSTIWAVSGFILAYGMAQKKNWNAKLLPTLALSYTAWYWSERFLWHHGKTNLPFAVAVNFIFLIIIYFATKSLSREAYERTNKHPKIE